MLSRTAFESQFKRKPVKERIATGSAAGPAPVTVVARPTDLETVSNAPEL
jgi:hypothetical protein